MSVTRSQHRHDIVDQPLDFSVKSSSSNASNSPSDPHATESHSIDEEVFKESHQICQQSTKSCSTSSIQLNIIDTDSSGDGRHKPSADSKRQMLVNDCASLRWNSSISVSNGSISPSSSSGRLVTEETSNASNAANFSFVKTEDEDEGGSRIKVRTANGVVNRRRPRAMPDEKKDDSYWERRRKNNEAAKRSRDARRQKEDDVAFACHKLEMENQRLREEIAELRSVIEQLRAEVLAREQRQQQEQRQVAENSENCDPVTTIDQQQQQQQQQAMELSRSTELPDRSRSRGSVISDEVES